MKPVLISVLVISAVFSAAAQNLEKSVAHFKKVIASPKINLVLRQGETESVKISYSNVDASKINVVVKHGVLKIYLDDSRFTEKQRRVQKEGWVNKESIYKDASITAYVTYKKIDKLVVRGEQEVDVQSAIENKKFKLSAYGQCDITMQSLTADWFKAALYGQHHLTIKAGHVESQKYKLFGENKIDAQALRSEEIASATYGESRLKLNANENLRLVTFGESDVLVKGNAEVNKFTFGDIAVKR